VNRVSEGAFLNEGMLGTTEPGGPSQRCTGRRESELLCVCFLQGSLVIPVSMPRKSHQTLKF
jgi:hypothetical protein